MTQQDLHVATLMLSKTINCHVGNIHCQLPSITYMHISMQNNQESPTYESTQTVLLIFLSLSHYNVVQIETGLD